MRKKFLKNGVIAMMAVCGLAFLHISGKLSSEDVQKFFSIHICISVYQ